MTLRSDCTGELGTARETSDHKNRRRSATTEVSLVGYGCKHGGMAVRCGRVRKSGYYAAAGDRRVRTSMSEYFLGDEIAFQVRRSTSDLC